MRISLKNLALTIISGFAVSVSAYADNEGVCATASLINPYHEEGGISGTGIPANGGVAGTGTPLAKGGVAGTGAPVVAKGGVAGTGAPLAKGGGIGGTGDQVPQYALLPLDESGGIAIMGVVTGFASICVNGEEVQYESSTPVYDNGNTAKLADLAVGKTVMLKVDKVNGQLHARAIGLFNAVTGPIRNVDAARKQINVMDQTVQVNETIIRQFSKVNANTVARVSGYRLNNGVVVASRIDLLGATQVANTLGLVTSVTADGFVVNGTKVSVDNRQSLQKIRVGAEVQVAGSWSDGKLKANHVEVQPISSVVNRTDGAILEGYVRKDAQSNVTISGTEVTLPQTESLAKQLGKFQGKLVKVELRRDNKGKWIADKIAERNNKLLENGIQFEDNKHGNSGSGKGESANDDSASGGSGSSESGSSGRHDASGSDSGSSESGRDSSGSGRDTSGSGRDSSGSGRDTSGSGRDSSTSGHDTSDSARNTSGSGGGDKASGKH